MTNWSTNNWDCVTVAAVVIFTSSLISILLPFEFTATFPCNQMEKLEHTEKNVLEMRVFGCIFPCGFLYTSVGFFYNVYYKCTCV